MRPPDSDDPNESAEFIGWQSSSPAGMARQDALDRVLGATESPLYVRPGVVNASQGQLDFEPDPAKAILGKFETDHAASSPPSSASRQLYGSPPKSASSSGTGVGLYSPGFLRRACEPPRKKLQTELAQLRSYPAAMASSPFGSPTPKVEVSESAEVKLENSDPDSDAELDWSLVDEQIDESAGTEPPATIQSGATAVTGMLSSDAGLDLSLIFSDAEEQDKKPEVPDSLFTTVRKGLRNALPELPDSDLDEYEENMRTEAPVLDIAIKSEKLHRYVVNAVNKEDESKQILSCTSSSGHADIILLQSWAASSVRPGDIIHVLGEFDISEPEVIVNNSQNLLVVRPDVLISSTNIADAFSCERKVVLRTRHRTKDDLTKPLVYGSLIHELIQICLLQGGPLTLTLLKRTLRTLVNDTFLESLCVIGVTPKEADMEITQKLLLIIEWSKAYWLGEPREAASAYRTTRSEKVAITKVVQAEHEIWSPLYGIKGKIDANVSVKTGSGAAFLTPLEIKTGKTTHVTSHISQVTMYLALMGDLLKTEIPFGLIYYTHTKTLLSVGLHWDFLRSLMQKRNEIVPYFEEMSIIPTPPDDPQACRYCAKSSPCALYAASDHFDWTGYTLQGDFEAKSAHLKQREIDFFKKWDALLSLEARESITSTKNVWCQSGAEREAKGECFAAAIVETHSMLTGEALNIRYEYVMRNENGIFPERTKLTEGSSIIISTDTDVAVSLGFMGVYMDDHRYKINVTQPLETGKSYRIDYDEYKSSFGVFRGNLINLLMTPSRLLESIVGLKTPEFHPEKGFSELGLDTYSEALNQEQLKALRMGMLTKDYSCVLGMPGTGKTTFIVRLVEALTAQGKSVLISSFTNSAVDNIVVKLLSRGSEVLRLGKMTSVHPDALPALAGYGDKAPTSPEDIKRIYMQPKIVATTAYGITSWLFVRRQFDVCILDEASQLTLPAAIGPLLQADRFIMVGDHFQLSPLVKDQAARRGGLGRSLFRTLCEAHPEAVTSLVKQYRMASDIMSLSSMLIYDNMLVCGNENVANQSLSLPNMGELQDRLASTPEWIQRVLDPYQRVLFLDIDTENLLEQRISGGISNPGEALVVLRAVKALKAAGVDSKEIGVISVYRAQRGLLKEMLIDWPEIEVLTADQAQGRDKDCIIVSLVRSNDQGLVGDLLRDWRRINVSFTRAKKKLIVVGSRRTLKSASALEKFLQFIDERSWNCGVTDINLATQSQ